MKEAKALIKRAQRYLKSKEFVGKIAQWLDTNS